MEFSFSYPEMCDDADRHLEALDRYTRMGVTSVVIAAKTHEAPATLEWIEAFRATYLR